MVLVFIGIVLVMFFGALFFYRRKKKVDRQGGVRGFVHFIFIYILWLIGAAAFIAVMYPMWRLKFWLTFLGSAVMIWIGWDRGEKTTLDRNGGELSGWQTLRKAMRTFGIIGLALSGVVIVLLHFLADHV